MGQSHLPYDPDHIIVKRRTFQGEFSRLGTDSQQEYENLGVASSKPARIGPYEAINASRIGASPDEEKLIMTVKEGEDPLAVAKRIEGLPGVLYAEPLYKVELYADPNDPGYAAQTAIKNTAVSSLMALSAGTEIKVAVVDTGVDYNHQDLVGRIDINTADNPGDNIDNDHNGYYDDTYGYNFYGYVAGLRNSDPMDGHGHGTHIAGIIAANKNNNLGIAGLYDRTKIIPIRFLDPSGYGFQVDAAQAIYYAVSRGAKIINCSWGYYDYNTDLSDAIRYAIAHNVIIIAAVGNDANTTAEYPASFDNVLTIGSVMTNGQRSSFSSYTPQLELMMYGNSIYSLLPGNGYGYKSGTSQSAAMMSGIAAAFWGQHPELTGEQVKQLLVNSGSSPVKSATLGYGIPNLTTLFSGELPIYEGGTGGILEIGDPMSLTQVQNFPNPLRTGVTTFGFSTNSDFGSDVTIDIYSLQGTRVAQIQDKTRLGYNNHIQWNGDNLDNGTYLYSITIQSTKGKQVKKGRLSLLR